LIVSSRVMPPPGSNRDTRINPLSMTTRIPSMVKLVSAMDVASTILRKPGGVGPIAASCRSWGRSP
jgi:hypothetical protein